MKRFRFVRALLAALIAVAIMHQFGGFTPKSGFEPVSNALAAQIPTIDGYGFAQKIRTNDKPTLVFIYASWCPHCRKQKPVMEQLLRDYGERLNILAISIDENANKLANYLGKHPGELEHVRVQRNDYLQFRTALAKTGSEFTGAIPYSALIGSDGNLMDEVSGFVDYRGFKSGLDELL